jgi:hypothetical protein
MTDAFTAVDVLVARMESNPEDFIHGGKFTPVADAVYEMILNYPNGAPNSKLQWMLTEQEQARLMAAYRNLARMQFQQEVFAKLCADPAEESRERIRIDSSGNVGIGAPKILGTQEVLAKAQELFTKAHDDYLRGQATEAQQNAARGVPWGSVANTFFGGKK